MGYGHPSWTLIGVTSAYCCYKVGHLMSSMVTNKLPSQGLSGCYGYDMVVIVCTPLHLNEDASVLCSRDSLTTC